MQLLSGEYLYINNATFSDAGEYECVVKSAVGQISSKSNIIVEGPPGPPGTILSLKTSYNTK